MSIRWTDRPIQATIRIQIFSWMTSFQNVPFNFCKLQLNSEMISDSFSVWSHICDLYRKVQEVRFKRFNALYRWFYQPFRHIGVLSRSAGHHLKRIIWSSFNIERIESLTFGSISNDFESNDFELKALRLTRASLWDTLKGKLETFACYGETPQLERHFTILANPNLKADWQAWDNLV